MAARDERGDQLYWLTWVEDLTERRRAEADVARHAEEMARSNAELDRFAGTVSHDLQSPMRVIAGCARVLERRTAAKLDPDERELVEHIVGGVHRMTALLDGIREWSRVRGDDAPLADVDCGCGRRGGARRCSPPTSTPPARPWRSARSRSCARIPPRSCSCSRT